MKEIYYNIITIDSLNCLEGLSSLDLHVLLNNSIFTSDNYSQVINLALAKGLNCLGGEYYVLFSNSLRLIGLPWSYVDEISFVQFSNLELQSIFIKFDFAKG